MKKPIFIMVCVILASCEGSDLYQGDWKATDVNENKFEINFAPKIFSIKDVSGNIKTYEYSQNSIKIENSARRYGISLDDGRKYQIYFPLKEQNVGFILDENGNKLYAISRKDYTTYQEIYKLD